MWIRRKVYKEILDDRDAARVKIYDLELELNGAKREYLMVQNTIATFKTRANVAREELETVKAQLEEREDVFIGKTVKKLLKSTGKREVINHYPPIHQRGFGRGIL
jgi:predicted  nucleic acid-binding Zn-ribbon protein